MIKGLAKYEIKIVDDRNKTFKKKSKNIRRKLKIKRKVPHKSWSWILPIILVSIVVGLMLVKPSWAFLLDDESKLSQYLLDNNLEVGIKVNKEGFDQVYFIIDEEKKFITDTNYSNAKPETDGSYVTWMSLIDGYWQIFLHEMITEKTIQLTRGGNNVNPKIDNGRVVWEGWINGSWQVFLSDGTAIIPITSGDMAINPMIEGNYVVYSRKDIDDQWRSEAYSVKEKKSLEISFGEENRYVELDQGKILLGTKEKARKTFPLLVEDLFLLNLPSLKEGDKTDTGVTAEEILNEINVLLKENESITVPLPATGSSY